MATVDYNELIEDIRRCRASDSVGCNGCKYIGSQDCKGDLLSKSLPVIERLQSIVNEYATYDGFLAAHGLFKTVEVPLRSEDDTTPLPKDEDHGYIVTITR